MHKMLTLVLNPKQSDRCTHLAKFINLQGGLVLLGKGYVNNKLLRAMGIKSKSQELLTYMIKNEDEKDILDFFTKELSLNQRGKGFAFTTHVLKADEFADEEIENHRISTELKEKTMFNKLTVIVDRGKAEEVMDIARNAGVKGGTVVHGRGTGAEFTETLLGMEIEPEKELVVILLPGKILKKVMQDLQEKMDLDTPGKGILFVEPVVSVTGLTDVIV